MSRYAERWMSGLLSAVVVASGCGKPDTGGTGLTTPPTTTEVTFSDVQEIFDDQCVSCHVTGGVMPDLLLTPAEAYDQLVNVPATTLDGIDRVKPGFPGESYLMFKIKGTQADVGGGGDSMPPEFLLPQGEVDTFEKWVTDGALP